MKSATPGRAPMWICSQIGAREHYAIARALHRGGKLGLLCTDYWAGGVLRGLNERVALGKTARALGARFHAELADAAIQSWNWRSLGWEAGLRYRWGRSEAGGPYAGFIEVGRRFATRVREGLKRWTENEGSPIVFAYDTGALETFEWCRERGFACVLNQMDPSRVEAKLVREEEKRWPGWRMEGMEPPEAYFWRREREWELADRVVVNSEFCAESMMAQGVPREKIAVIPLCFEPEGAAGAVPVVAQKAGKSGDGPLRVLWLGQVILRKGIQYLMEAARQLAGEKIHFDIVGPVGISQKALASAPANMTFHGRVSRTEAKVWYSRAHMFVLPTLSDGFAITQLEAMACGLPVVATPCCGAVVTDGLDGFLVPPRDAGALSGAFQHYLDEPGLLETQKVAAFTKSRRFSMDQLAKNLQELELSLRQTGRKN